MLKVELGVTANRLVPTLGSWLQGAFFQVDVVDETTPRDRSTIRIMTPADLVYATHRDVLIEYRDGAPELHLAHAGMPARIAFGFEDMALGHALIAELLRPAGMPAVGEPESATLMRLASRIAQSDATVLIQGDTGTGKEGMARFLHAKSCRVDKDFIAVNCAALPETMMEAMLFGHKKGSFTGAGSSSEGLFLAADGGTLFLDEIAELPLSLQAKLLRALQEGEILPVGATHAIPVDVRVIAAGNRDLATECDEGRFRSDLYWRLNVMPLHLKPLAQRRQDIRAIAAAILIRHQSGRTPPPRFVWPTAQAMERMMAHDWPGNARELGNVLQRALVLHDGDRIEASDLNITAATPAVAVQPVASYQDVTRASKLDVIRAALRETDGHRAQAARKLGISERTLRYRLAEMRELAAA